MKFLYIIHVWRRRKKNSCKALDVLKYIVYDYYYHYSGTMNMACYFVYVLSFDWNCVRKHSVLLGKFPLIQVIKVWKMN